MQDQPQPTDICAIYARVSQPKQRIEQQYAAVDRFCKLIGLHVPDQLRFADKGFKRHQSDKRPAFQRLLQVAKSGKITWVLVAFLDRWGVGNLDEFCSYRLQLREAGVRLWSVQDQVDLTSLSDNDFSKIFDKVLASISAMKNQADKNLNAMAEMAEAGFHASSNHPYGTDLVCVSHDERSNEPERELFRVHLLDKVNRKTITLKIIDYETGTEKIAHSYPPRDPKKSHYRLARSIDESRIEAVQLIFELFQSGLTYAAIGSFLESKGLYYFGKRWSWGVIDSILKNPNYTGKIHWGKMESGYYRHLTLNGAGTYSGEVPRKEKNEPIRKRRQLTDCVVSENEVFAPIIPQELFDQVAKQLCADPTRNYKRPRRKNRAIHPLNGLIVCPDCGKPMVSNAAMRFICSTYSKAMSAPDCRTNTVQYKFLDEAMASVLLRVKTQLDELATVGETDLATATRADLEKQYRSVASYLTVMERYLVENGQPVPTGFANLVAAYETQYAASNTGNAKRLDEIEARILKLGDLMEAAQSPTLSKKWIAEIKALEVEKAQLETQADNLADQLRQLLANASAISKRLDELEATEAANLWSTFIERVVPRFELQEMKNGKTRTKLIGFEFVAKTAVSNTLGQTVFFHDSPKGIEILDRLAELFGGFVPVAK